MRRGGQGDRAGGPAICGALLATVLLLTGCGSSATTLRLHADVAGIDEAADRETAIQETLDILRQRVDRFGAGNAEITAEGETITVSLSGMDEEVARRLLLPRGVVEFRQPVLTDTGFVTCRDATGVEFSVHPLRVNADSTVGNRVRCFGEDQIGDPVWELTPTIFVQAQELTLADLIETGSWEIRSETSLAPQFNEAGSELLREVTEALVGYALGVFVDGELLGAPRIQRTITNGNPLISGFTELEARIRRAQFNVRPLPIALGEG